MFYGRVEGWGILEYQRWGRGDERRPGTTIPTWQRNWSARKGEAYLCSLHLELHVVFSRRLAVFALLPAVPIPTVAHLFAAV
jgi:hypothetical protein